MLSLKRMTETKLKVLKREVEAALQARVATRRQEIESELSRLSLLDGGGHPKVVRAAAKGMGAAKYRKPAPTQPKKTRNKKKVGDAGSVTQPVLLTSTKTDPTEPLCIEPLNDPVPIEALSRASLYPNNTPGDLGGASVAAVAP
jgi:hypothetical protein